MHTFPQNVHLYLACWVISIFFTILRKDEPYLVPYLPTIPTFLVLFAYLLLNILDIIYSLLAEIISICSFGYSWFDSRKSLMNMRLKRINNNYHFICVFFFQYFQYLKCKKVQYKFISMVIIIILIIMTYRNT